MDLLVFLAVLGAAACHAGWNALLKINVEPLVATILVAVASGLVVLPFAVVTGAPGAAAWPYLVASVIIHIGYYVTLAEAYRTGDLGQVYPIARGSAPLLTAGLATLWLGETPGLYGWSGIVVLVIGILLLTFKGGRLLHKLDRRAIGFALLTSLTITMYTLVDGSGARVSTNPWAYAVWLFVLSGAVMALYGFWRIGASLVGALTRHWSLALAGATLSTAAYAIAIWAMTVAPIALVAALRETSVLFAALFSAFLLREPLLPARILSALLVLAGVVLLRLR
jgi:drug/metabolite transporter (DMT)-like permease